MAGKTYFCYKVIPPRPSFFTDQTDGEAAIMGAHARYWTEHLQDGKAVAFGPVLEPHRVWGLGLIEADDLAEAQRLVDADPVVTSGLATTELHEMPGAIVRPASGPTT